LEIEMMDKFLFDKDEAVADVNEMLKLLP